MRLEIDFLEETATSCAYLHFHQDGTPGLKLPLACLPELVEALERPGDSQVFYFWQTFGVRTTRSTCSVHKYAIDKPLLQLSNEQRAKLVAHLRATYAVWL